MPLGNKYPYTLDPMGNQIPIKGKVDKMGNKIKTKYTEEDEPLPASYKSKPLRMKSPSEQYNSDKQLLC